MKMYIWEALMAFLFTLLALQLWHSDATTLVPLAIGLAWFSVLSIRSMGSAPFGNPGYLVAALLLDRVEDRREAPYRFVAMFGGSAFAVPFSTFLLGCTHKMAVAMVHPDAFCAFFAEFLGCGLLTMVFLRTREQSPVVQGAVLAVLLYAFSGLSAGAFHPALAFAYALCGRIPWGDFPFTLAANLFGAAAAATLEMGIRQDLD
ncbi:MAG: hypothetical protein SFV52_11310 [Saprospiraceae bacterium]|nr:hypothetical protein [Saprospiraceae bacterium]